MKRVRLVRDLRLELGEGPLWDWRTETLWFVDIAGGGLHGYRPSDRASRAFELGGTPSFVALARRGGLLLGNRADLWRFDQATISGSIARLDLPARTRLNDGCVDPLGRLWFGSMNAAAADGGAVYRLTDNGVIATQLQCRVPNGPAFSVNGDLLYHVDTVAGRIDRYDLRTDLSLERPEPLVTIDPKEGKPDGLTIDAEDHLWVCVWDGGEARRYAPDGLLVETVALPASQVTKLAFGGPDLKTAFVTTARRGLDADTLKREPLAGGLFAFHVAVPGIRAALAVAGAS